MTGTTLQIQTPRWALPLLEPARYKGIFGGRGSSKSHTMAEMLVEEHILNPDLRSVCIREIQKSLKFSAKSLIEAKIKQFNVGHMFDILQTEIRRKDGDGLIIFQGMQDHTAETIKSLEGFDRAWVEEAQSLSDRSIRLLRPTIRKEGSELWFTWNPENQWDAIEQLLRVDPPNGAVVVHVNYDSNSFIPQVLLDEMEHDRKYNADTFGHVWLGEYNERSEAQVLKDKWRVDEFEPLPEWDGPYFGLDFGFSQDPTAAVQCYIHDKNLYIYREAGRVGLELDDTAPLLTSKMPDIARHVCRADSARPESISYLKRHGLPRIEGVKKWPGSVEDGISFLRSFDEIVIHLGCKEVQKEARLYCYKTNKAGDVLNVVEDKHNHFIDSARYALAPLIKHKQPASVEPLRI